MKKNKSRPSLKLPAASIPKIKIKTLSKEELSTIKATRSFGVKNLKKRIRDIRKNIQVFQEAIYQQRQEIKQTNDMIKVLESDIQQVNRLKS